MRPPSHADFVAEFPITIPGAKIKGIDQSSLEIDRDVVLSGILGPVTVRSGAKVLLSGIVRGPLTVERGAVVYVMGIVGGDVTVNGAAAIDGIIEGRLLADDAATVAMDGIVELAPERFRCRGILGVVRRCCGGRKRRPFLDMRRRRRYKRCRRGSGRRRACGVA